MDKEKSNDHAFITARGYLLFLLGVIMLFNYYLNIRILGIYIGIGFIVSGGLVIYSTLLNFKFNFREIWSCSEGFIDLLAAILILIFSKSNGYAVYIIFGAWAILIGALQLAKTHYSMRSIANSVWITRSFDIVQIVLGILIIIHPSPSRTLEHTFIGLYLLIYAVIYLAESFHWKSAENVSV